MRKSNELEMNPMDLKRFHWNKQRHVLAAELSELGFRAGATWLQRIYNDSVDTGITIKNYQTGKTEKFVLVSAAEDEDGDTQCWTLHPIDLSSIVKSVVIFND